MWYFSKNDEQQGPVEPEVLRERLSNGDLSLSTLVWTEGMANWVPLGEVPELSGAAGGATNAATAAATAAAGVPSTATPYAPPMSANQPQLQAPAPQNTTALMSLILGIVSFVCAGPFTSIPAVICGHIAIKQFRNSPTPQSGQGMAKAGLILGYINLALFLLFVVVFLVFALLGPNSVQTL